MRIFLGGSYNGTLEFDLYKYRSHPSHSTYEGLPAAALAVCEKYTQTIMTKLKALVGILFGKTVCDSYFAELAPERVPIKMILVRMFGRHVHAVVETSTAAGEIEIDRLILLSNHPEARYHHCVDFAVTARHIEKMRCYALALTRNTTVRHEHRVRLRGWNIGRKNNGGNSKINSGLGSVASSSSTAFSTSTATRKSTGRKHSPWAPKIPKYRLSDMADGRVISLDEAETILLDMWCVVAMTGNEFAREDVPAQLRHRLDFDIAVEAAVNPIKGPGTRAAWHPLSTRSQILRDISPLEDTSWLQMSVEPSLIERLDPEKSALGAAFASILIPAMNSLYFEKRRGTPGERNRDSDLIGLRLRLRMARILEHAGIPFFSTNTIDASECHIRCALRLRRIMTADTVWKASNEIKTSRTDQKRKTKHDVLQVLPVADLGNAVHPYSLSEDAHDLLEDIANTEIGPEQGLLASQSRKEVAGRFAVGSPLSRRGVKSPRRTTLNEATTPGCTTERTTNTTRTAENDDAV
jgi:hypothetical protein